MITSLTPYGDHAFLIACEGKGRTEDMQPILALAASLRSTRRFIDVIPAYASITVSFDPLKLSPDEARSLILVAATSAQSAPILDAPVIELPVCYAQPHALDLKAASEALGLQRKDIITRHSAPEYLVSFLGFLPGFTFLSRLDKSLVLPRRAAPRAVVPAGSVGIANWQTGIYSLQSPGGWQILGATPLVLFDPTRRSPFLFEAGQRIKFVPISTGEFDALREKQAQP